MRWLSLSLVSMVLVATIGLSWLFDVLYDEYLSSSEAESQDTIVHAEALTRQLARALAKSDDADEFINAWESDSGYDHNYVLQKVPLAELVLPEFLIQSLKNGEPLNLESDTDISVHFLIPNSDEVLVLQLPNSPQAESHFINRYWFTSAFYLILITLFLLWVRPLIARLISLRNTAKAFGKGDLTTRIPVAGASYISDLETEFNHMAQRIEDLVSDVKLLSSAVSHDLRTPLARIRMGLDTLSEESDPVKRQSYEDRINDHIDDMVELIETLLSYARLDQAMLELEKAPVDLRNMLDRIQIRKQLPGKYLTFECAGENANYQVYGDSTYLKMLCNNLVQNALQHCQSQVKIILTQQDEQIAFSVSDDGTGIPQELMADVFKPFVRSRTNNHKGHGVGLAICKRVTDWHKGNIAVSKSTELGGAEFIVQFPKAKDCYD